MHAEREIVNLRTLAAKIEDLDLGVGDTTVEPGLGIRLEGTQWLADWILNAHTGRGSRSKGGRREGCEKVSQPHDPIDESSGVQNNSLTLFLQYR